MRILIADDHEMIRQGVRVVLESRPDFVVCGEARTGREAVSKAKQLCPDVVVLDFGMPELNGLEATRQIRAALPQTEVLILTMHQSEQLVRAITATGASGFVLKSDAGKVLVHALEELRDHRTFFSRSVSGWVPEREFTTADAEIMPAEETTPLTLREREIAQLIAEGRTSKEVADALGISAKTAETHRANIMRKLNLHSVSELVRYAIRHRMIEA
ncbi:MAG: response regulator transcription factor [Verrucomicrobiota bacterium]